MKTTFIREKMRAFAYHTHMVRLTMLVSMMLGLALITGALYFKSSVYITDNGYVKEIKTNETEVEAILNEADITLSEGDKTTLTREDNKIYINIARAFNVTVNADGKTYNLRMTEGNVTNALIEAGVKLGEYDFMDKKADDRLFGGIEINVSRVTYVTREEKTEIAFETEYVDDSNLKIGTQQVITEGQTGEIVEYYSDKYVDGKLVESKKTGETTAKEPVTEVIGRGTSLQVPYAKLDDPDKVKLVNGLPEDYVKVVSGKATAYSARAGARTASGRYAVVGTVAVNPNVIPYGSELYIVAQDGSRVYGYAIAADTGTGLMDGRVTVDVFMGSYADSCKWGACYVDVYVLKMGNNKYVG